MKKTLVLLLAVFLSSTLAQAKVPEKNLKKHPCPPPICQKDRLQREHAFDQRLGLTEEQKQQAKTIRMQGREKIKPLMEEIKAKESAKELVRKSTLDEKKREEKLNSLNSDLKTLHKRAHDIRIENMKEFESILTVEQRKTLKEMKQEGRHEFNKHRVPPKPPEEK